jgi:hypothetical protein
MINRREERLLIEEKLQELESIIETLRKQLHAAYEEKKMFSDPEIYRLSITLDDAIAEYQRKLSK